MNLPSLLKNYRAYLLFAIGPVTLYYIRFYTSQLQEVLRTDRLILVDPTNSIGKQVGDTEDMYLIAFFGVRNTIRENQFGHRRVLNPFAGRVAHHCMRSYGTYLKSSSAHH